MNRRKAIAAISLAARASAQSKDSKMRHEFAGVWRLASSESKDRTTGEVRYPFGAKPVGRINYDAAGRMSALLMDPARRSIGGPATRGSAAAIRTLSADDMRALLTGFLAYLGTYDVDEPSKTVIHHVQACLIPSWVGADLRRTYEFSGRNRLILTAAVDQAVNRLIWEREEG
jgi:hypothetical protein